jgi:hypothetical protein
MNNIFLIGGPATLTGVDRISDDLVSILSVVGLYSRKAVIAWPTKEFLSLPAVLDSLQPYLDMNTVVWPAIESKGRISLSGWCVVASVASRPIRPSGSATGSGSPAARRVVSAIRSMNIRCATAIWRFKRARRKNDPASFNLDSVACREIMVP